MPFHAWACLWRCTVAKTRERNSQTRPCFHRKKKTKEKQSNTKTCEELLLYVWYFMFASWWQAESCWCYYRTFTVNSLVIANVTLSHFEFELACLLDLRFFKAFSSHISEHIISIRQVFTKCRCSSCIFSAKIFLTSDLFNIYIMLTTSCVVHFE